MNRCLCSLAAMIATVAISTPVEATLLASFETIGQGNSEGLNVGDLGSVGTASGGEPIGTVVDSGNGITEGSQASRAVNSSGFYDKIGSVALQGLIDPVVPFTTFTVDWYFEAAPGSAGGYNGFAGAIGGDGPFTQMTTTSGNEFIGADAGSNGLYTVVYELNPTQAAGYQALLQAGTNLQLELFSNKDGNGVVGTYTVDNIRFDGAVIPEPSALFLSGVGLLVIASRRK